MPSRVSFLPFRDYLVLVSYYLPIHNIFSYYSDGIVVLAEKISFRGESDEERNFLVGCNRIYGDRAAFFFFSESVRGISAGSKHHAIIYAIQPLPVGRGEFIVGREFRCR